MKNVAIVAALVGLLGVLAWGLLRPARPKQGLAALDAEYARLRALPAVVHDFTTPEGAIACLEDAYRKHDLDAAVAAKDFRVEARLMLQKLGSPVDEKTTAEAAEVLQLSFRRHTAASWPDFTGLESFFPKREPYADRVVVVSEVIRYPDHGFSRQRLLVAQTDNGWRVLNPVDD